MTKNNIAVLAVVVALVGAAAFFSGMKYQENRSSKNFGQFAGNSANQGRNRGQSGQRSGGRPVAGEIISQDDKSITVKLSDGSSKIVIISDTTQINKAETAGKVDLAVGQKVAVFGSENADGSVTAGNIQLNPQFRMGTPSASPR